MQAPRQKRDGDLVTTKIRPSLASQIGWCLGWHCKADASHPSLPDTTLWANCNSRWEDASNKPAHEHTASTTRRDQLNTCHATCSDHHARLRVSSTFQMLTQTGGMSKPRPKGGSQAFVDALAEPEHLTGSLSTCSTLERRPVPKPAPESTEEASSTFVVLC